MVAGDFPCDGLKSENGNFDESDITVSYSDDKIIDNSKIRENSSSGESERTAWPIDSGVSDNHMIQALKVVSSTVDIDRPGLWIAGLCENNAISMLLDTGASVSLLAHWFWDKELKSPSLESIDSRVVCADGKDLRMYGLLRTEINIGDSKMPIKIIIVDMDHMAILGLDALKDWQAIVDVDRGCITIEDGSGTCTSARMESEACVIGTVVNAHSSAACSSEARLTDSDEYSSESESIPTKAWSEPEDYMWPFVNEDIEYEGTHEWLASMVESMSIPARTVVIADVTLRGAADSQVISGDSDIVIERLDSFESRTGLRVGRSLVRSNADGVKLEILNLSNSPVYINRGTNVGIGEIADCVEGPAVDSGSKEFVAV